MNEKAPLSVTLETARRKLVSAVNEVLDETKLPAYLVEGVFLGILADLRARKTLELIADYNAMKKEGQ